MTQSFNDIDINAPAPETDGELLALAYEDPSYGYGEENEITDNEGDESIGSNVDWSSMQPVDDNGYRSTDEVDTNSLTPDISNTQNNNSAYDYNNGRLNVLDEATLKAKASNLQEYRANLAWEVVKGNMTLEEAQAKAFMRHQDICNDYGVDEVPEFSMSKFKTDPWRTIVGETAGQVPFLLGAFKKGVGVSIPLAVTEGGAGAMAGGIPGAIGGVINGISHGLAVGGFWETANIEFGNTYLDLRDKGVSHDTAIKSAVTVGVINGVLEDVGLLFGPVGGVVSKAANTIGGGLAKKMMMKEMWQVLEKNPAMKKWFENRMLNITTDFLKRQGIEVTTEMAQDVTNNVMTLWAAHADSIPDAAPEWEDWKQIITKTGPAAFVSSMAFGTMGMSFDVLNPNVGAIKARGDGKIDTSRITKESLAQNDKTLREGGTLYYGSELLLHAEIAYDSVEDTMGELESEYTESQEYSKELSKKIKELSKKKNLTDKEKEELQYYNEELAGEENYRLRLEDRMNDIRNGQKKSEKQTDRKKELLDKSKKEALSKEEKEELADLTIEEEKLKGEENINDNTRKARKRILDKEIRDNDLKHDKIQKREQEARENRNKIEEEQDKISQKINELEKDNAEIEKAIKETDIDEDIASMKMNLAKNKEQIKDLKKHSDSLENQRQTLNEEIESLINEGEELGRQRDTLNEERSLLEEGGQIDENGKIEMTAGGYKNIQLSALAAKLKALKQGLKQGEMLTRREIRDIQRTATRLFKKAQIDPKDKARLLAKIKDLNSQEKFNRILPELVDTISAMEEKHNKNQLLNYIGKLIKQARPKKGGKRPVGKFTADIQKFLDKVTNATKMTTEQAYSEIEKIFDSLEDNLPTPEQSNDISILFNFSDLKSKTSSQLLQNARAIKMMLEEGKMLAGEMSTKRKEARQKLLEEAKESINGTLPATGNRIPSKIDSIKQWGRAWGHTLDTWWGLMNIASLHDKNRKLAKLLDVFDSKRKRIANEQYYFSAFAHKAMKALGIVKVKDFYERVNRDSIIEDIGYYTNQEGKKVKFQASRAEARKLYMEMQDPTLKDSLIEGNKYTFKSDIEDKSVTNNVSNNVTNDIDNVLNTLYDKKKPELSFMSDTSTEQLLETYLTAEDKALCKVELDFYRDYYKRLNKFYRDKYFIDMPYNENYSPIKRKVDEGDGLRNWMESSSYAKSMAPTSFISRKTNKNPLALQNDFALMQYHIATSEHFIAMDEFVTNANTVFRNNEIRDIIQEKYGKGFLSVIDNHLKDIMNNGVQSVEQGVSIFNKARNLFTMGTLGLKTKIFMTQLTGIMAFSDTLAYKDFAAGVIDFLTHPKKCISILSESPIVQDREGALNIEIQDFLKSQGNYKITNYKNDFAKVMFWLTQKGDKASIYAGGWAVYKDTLKKTGDKKAALNAFERAIDKCQQSAHIDNLNTWQRGGAFTKSLVTFMSDQTRQLQIEVHAIRDAIINKDFKSIRNAADKILVFHVLMPMFAQYAANGFAWDSDDETEAAILGPFVAIPLIGRALNWGVGSAVALLKERDKLPPLPEFSPAFYRPVTKILSMVAKDLHNPPDSEDWLEILYKYLREVAPSIGLPRMPLDVMHDFGRYGDEGEHWNQARLLMGVSPYIIDTKGKNEE